MALAARKIACHLYSGTDKLDSKEAKDICTKQIRAEQKKCCIEYNTVHSILWIRSLSWNLSEHWKYQDYTAGSLPHHSLFLSIIDLVCPSTRGSRWCHLFQHHNLLLSVREQQCPSSFFFQDSVLTQCRRSILFPLRLDPAGSPSGSLAWIFLRTLSVSLSAHITCIKHDGCFLRVWLSTRSK